MFAENEYRVIESINTIHPIYDRNIASYATYYTPSLDKPSICDIELQNSLTSKIRNVSINQSNTRSHSTLLCNKTSHIFGVGLETAKRTLSATTQLALCQSMHPIQRCYHTEVAQLHYSRLGGQHGKFHSDTFFASTQSLSNCTIGQMYTNNIHFTKYYPMRLKSDAPDTLIPFMQDIGILSDLHSDDAKELTQGRIQELMKKFWIKGSQSEPLFHLGK